MNKLIIFNIPQSNFGRSILMLAEEKGIDYEMVVASPHSDKVKEVHPFGKVPALQYGEFRLCESTAMATYIDSTFEGPKLFPEDTALRAKVDEWVSLHASLFDPTMIRKYAFAYVFPGTEDGSPNKTVIESCIEDVCQQLSYIDSKINDGFLVGGKLTYADLALYPTLHYMTQFPESAKHISSLEGLKGYIAKLAERDSAQKTKPPSAG